MHYTLKSENVRFFCPTCVCYTRGWLPGVWEPFLSFRFTTTILSRGSRGRAEQVIHGTISQIYICFNHQVSLNFLSLLCTRSFDLTTIKSHEISSPCSLHYRFFLETTIKSHEISSLCSLQDRFFWGGETIIKATASWSICSWQTIYFRISHRPSSCVFFQVCGLSAGFTAYVGRNLVCSQFLSQNARSTLLKDHGMSGLGYSIACIWKNRGLQRR